MLFRSTPMAWCIGNSSVVRKGPAVSQNWRSPSPGSDGQQGPGCGQGWEQGVGVLCPWTLLSRAGCRLSLYLFPWPSGFQASSAERAQDLAALMLSLPLTGCVIQALSACRRNTRALTLTHSCLVWLLCWLGSRSQPGEACRWPVNPITSSAVSLPGTLLSPGTTGRRRRQPGAHE